MDPHQKQRFPSRLRVGRGEHPRHHGQHLTRAARLVMMSTLGPRTAPKLTRRSTRRGRAYGLSSRALDSTTGECRRTVCARPPSIMRRASHRPRRMPFPIPIADVAAVIERDGALLVTLRPDGTHLAEARGWSVQWYDSIGSPWQATLPSALHRRCAPTLLRRPSGRRESTGRRVLERACGFERVGTEQNRFGAGLRVTRFEEEPQREWKHR